MLEWLFGSRRKLLEQPITVEEQILLDQSLWQAHYLSKEDRQKLIRWCRVFCAEKNWEGCNGQKIDDSIRWSIAAPAALMVLAYPGWYFDKTKTILVYPTPYIARVETRLDGLSGNIPAIMGEFPRAGETIYRGPVIVNCQDIDAAKRSSNEGYHLAIHEFAHQLDLINSPFADGLPPLPADIDELDWKNSMHREFQAARQEVADGHRIGMDHYGLTKESEFFAVASESYFQCPSELFKNHPRVFELLLQFYRTDLRTWLPAWN